MKVGIIIGSIRDGRKGEQVGRWVAEVAAKREGGVEYELIDLKDFDVPLLTTNTHPMQAKKHYEDERVQRWSDAVDACDAYVFVTPEYNHAVPGAFKNAVDSLGAEWVGKVVGYVGYGSVGGVRAIDNWRLVMSNFSAISVRTEVNLSIFTVFEDGNFKPLDRHVKRVDSLFDDVEKLAARVQD